MSHDIGLNGSPRKTMAKARRLWPSKTMSQANPLVPQNKSAVKCDRLLYGLWPLTSSAHCAILNPGVAAKSWNINM